MKKTTKILLLGIVLTAALIITSTPALGQSTIADYCIRFEFGVGAVHLDVNTGDKYADDGWIGGEEMPLV